MSLTLLELLVEIRAKALFSPEIMAAMVLFLKHWSKYNWLLAYSKWRAHRLIHHLLKILVSRIVLILRIEKLLINF